MENMFEMEAASLVGQPSAALSEQFTPRQFEVLELLCEGLPNKLIGRRLNIAAATVKIHVGCILRTLKVSSRLQAVLAVRSLGIEFESGNAPEEETIAAPRSPVILRLVPDDEDASRTLDGDSDWSLAAAAG